MTVLTRNQQREPLSGELLHRMDAYWRAANYLSVGQIYLCGNPLLRQRLAPEHIKRMLLGALGDDARPEFHLCASQPTDQSA